MKQTFHILPLFTLCFCLLFIQTVAQDTNQKNASSFENKLHIGFSYNNYWTTITGDNLPSSYFYKPSLGFLLKAEYYITSAIGISVGVGFQQRGAGIISPDLDQSPGNPDSTYLKRLRFNSVEIPISILIRTPKDVINGVRLKTSVGLISMTNIQSNQVFLSVGDGNHTSTDVSTEYWKNDMALQIALGPDIDTGAGVLQVDLVYTRGLKNAFNSTALTGYNQSYGFRLSWMFPYRSKKSH